MKKQECSLLAQLSFSLFSHTHTCTHIFNLSHGYTSTSTHAHTSKGMLAHSLSLSFSLSRTHFHVLANNLCFSVYEAQEETKLTVFSFSSSFPFFFSDKKFFCCRSTIVISFKKMTGTAKIEKLELAFEVLEVFDRFC